MKDSGILRSDLFKCGSVVSNRAQGYEAAYQSMGGDAPSIIEEHKKRNNSPSLVMWNINNVLQVLCVSVINLF